MSEARLHRLPNGLTIAVEPMDGVETLAVGLYADVGSRSEPEGLTGLAHMVEHMVFKGAGSRDAKAIAEAVEDRGGSLNAWTSRDQTVFHARLLSGDLALGMDLIADLVRAPRFDAGDLVREKQVVLAELGEARDTPDDIVFDHLSTVAFPDQPLGRPVLGDEASIDAIDVPALRSWLENQFRPERLLVAAAGKIDEDALLRLVEARFGDLDQRGLPGTAPANFVGGAFSDVRDFDQTHLAFGFPAPAITSDATFAMSLFAAAAGGGMSSRLFQELRENRGLAYSVYAFAQAWADTGMLGIYCAAQRGQGAAALALARDVLARTVETLDEAELARAKAQAKAGLLMGLESVAARCDHLARQIQVYGRIVTHSETVAQLDAVSVAQARAAGEASLGGGFALASVGGEQVAA